MGIKSLIQHKAIELWDDVYDDTRDDAAAPDLSDALATDFDAEEFLSRTYYTKSVENVLTEVNETLKSDHGRVFILTSLFGGGKTHALITLYHVCRANSGEAVRTMVMDASRATLVPHPDEPYKEGDFTIKTIWGMMAYQLGAYERVKHLDSEEAPSPDIDLIKAIFSEKKEPLLIIMDEIVHYVFNMEKSHLKDYGEKVLLFLDFLARAVEDTPHVALIVSVQAEYQTIEGKRYLVEEDIFRGYAQRVLSVLNRESARSINPLAPEDLANVLKRRIFKKISGEEGLKATEIISKTYREYPELFGVEPDWFPGTGTDTYPFHPHYITVLQNMVTRNKDLQKTRDAIKITRKVMRRVLRSGEDAAFIMPWHIDLRDADVRTRILTDSYREFREVAATDITTEENLGAVARCSNPFLALRISTSIFLSVYTYETFREPLTTFPDMKTVALMIYEPETFAAENLYPPDIKTALTEMIGRLPHFNVVHGHTWFTPYPSVIEYVEKRAKELSSRADLFNMLKTCAGTLLVGSESGKERVFTEKNSVIISYGEAEEVFVKDNPQLSLVVLVKQAAKEDIRKIILMEKGGRRTFRNTVCVVSLSPGSFEALLECAARMKAAQEMKDVLGEYYTDEEIRSLQERKLTTYTQEHETVLQKKLAAALTQVAYPVNGEKGDEVAFVTVPPHSSIVSQVEAGLKDPGTGPKLRTHITFANLASFLKRTLNWDLIHGERREFKDIVYAFYTSTKAPFTTREALEKAVLEGVETLDIGAKMDDVLFWNRVDGTLIPETVSDAAEILPYKAAAALLKDVLLKEEGEHTVEGKIYRVWYEVECEKKRVKLEDLVVRKGWEDILKRGKVIKQEKIIEKGVYLKVVPSLLEVMPGELVKVHVAIRAVAWDEDVQLSVNQGKITNHENRAPFEVDWYFNARDEPGEYTYGIEANSGDTTVKADLLIHVRSLEEEICVNSLHDYQGATLVRISTNNPTSVKMMLDIVSKLNVKALATINIGFEENITFLGENMDVKVAALFIQKFTDILRSLPSLAARSTMTGFLNFTEPVVLDQPTITAFSILEAQFTVKE